MTLYRKITHDKLNRDLETIWKSGSSEKALEKLRDI
jgi:hypothetical protein